MCVCECVCWQVSQGSLFGVIYYFIYFGGGCPLILKTGQNPYICGLLGIRAKRVGKGEQEEGEEGRAGTDRE